MADVPEDPGGGPIFLLGLVQRTGTELAKMLFALHPHCRLRWDSHAGNEDWLLRHAHLLDRYTDEVSGGWKPEIPAEERTHLLESIGGGLLDFVQPPGSDTRVVVKTPSVRNLDLLTTLFPTAHAIVLVRDGRDVTESGTRTFGWSHAGAARRWAEGASTVRAVLDNDPLAAERILCVRYEDLANDLAATLPGVFRFCGLDPDAYDMDAAASLPVRGSSQLAVTEGSVDWKPRERTESFVTTGRWAGWSPYQHQLFEQIAGEHQRYFGYVDDDVDGGRGRSTIHDLRARLEIAARSRGLWARDALSGALRSASGDSSG